MPETRAPEKPESTRTRRADSAPRRIKLTVLRLELQRTLIQTATFAHDAVLHEFDSLRPTSARAVSVLQVQRLQSKLVQSLPDLVRKHAQGAKRFESYPERPAHSEITEATKRLQIDVQAAFERARLAASLTAVEKREILTGMLRTRILDARLKKFFTSGEIKTPEGQTFQGKGFRSMGQEAIYAAGIRLRRGPAYQRDGTYTGDFVAPMIRDLGLALAMGVKPYDVMAAQMGKIGLPTNGKDLHIGDFSCGVLPPAAPIGISTATAGGLGWALKGSGRVVINCNGDGGTSTGEWHETANLAAVHRLPIVFVLQNNQTALATPVHEQFACNKLAERALGYGIHGITVDGTDPEAVFAAVTQAAEACRRGNGPVFVELVCMRMCGHAHHDDMLYFGHEPDQFLTYPELKPGGYIDVEKYEFWQQRDPIEMYRRRLEAEGVVSETAYQEMSQEITAEIESAAQEVIAAPWPATSVAAGPVFAGGDKIEHHEPLAGRQTPLPVIPEWQSAEPVGFQADADGKTFWQAIAVALAEEMRRDHEVFILGEDVGGTYGNAFVILRSLLQEFGDRIINTPLAEGAILGTATGAALLGKRPVAEIQFNDFVACGFNQLVNNTAKIFYRWEHPVPVTVRLPWGGLRQAGPYHSQNTEPWFYRTPGLKIVCPSTPREAKALLKSAIRDDNPVLFYEHIALYRDAHIKQHLPSESEDLTLPIGKAHLKRDGDDLAIITYGAFVHRCLAVAEKLEKEHGISALVLDLRSLVPLDKAAILWSVKKTSRVLIVHEDSKTGGIGQSVASIIAEEAFEYLDAPIRVLGALDTPVPYSPPLEACFLVGEADIMQAARLLLDY